MNQPLVSICIPAYNSEEYIKDTIESLLQQTYSNIEIVVSDDCSKDNTCEIVAGFQDKRVKLYRNQTNLGMVGNWNRCLELGKGEFLKLVCADDMLDNTAIEKEAFVLRNNPSVVLVESYTRLVDNDNKPKGAYHRYHVKGIVDGKKVAKKALIFKNYFGAPVNNMFRKTAYEKTGGFDKSFTYILDFDMWVSLAMQGDVYIIHELLNSFRVRNDSNTGNLVNNDRETFTNEHRALVEKYARIPELKLTSFDVKLSVFIRKMRNFAIKVYLILFAK